MAIHECTECGLIHDMAPADPVESDAVKIARIEADARIAEARYASRREEDWNDTRVEVARIEAKAEVAAAEVEGEVIAAAIQASDIEAEPVEIVAPDLVNDVDVDVDEDAPEPIEGSPVPATESKTHFGMW